MLKSFPTAVARQILDSSKKSRRGNPVSVRKTYWVSVYAAILASNRALFVLQDNNTSASTLFALKNKLKAMDWNLMHIQNGLFRAASASSDMKTLGVFPVGNCMLAFSDKSDSLAPSLLLNLIAVLKPHHIDLVGGMMDGMLLTHETTHRVSSMPNLSRQREEIVAVLGASMQELVGVLGRSQEGLVRVLESHQGALKE